MAKKNKEVARRAAADPAKKERMMAILIQNDEVYNAVAEALKPELFPSHDMMYSVLWGVVKKFKEEHEDFPDYQLLQAEVSDVLGDDPDLLNDTEIDELNQFIDFAFDKDSFDDNPATSSKYARWAIKQFRAFLEERIAHEARDQIYKDNSVPVNLPDLLDDLQNRVEQVRAVADGTVKPAFPEDWDKKTALQLFSTGISFLDRFLGGGHANGELYGILGPYGSCKTTLAIMILVNAAKAFLAQSKTGDNPKKKIAFMVSYEARLPEMRARSLGYAAKVQRSTMESMTSKDDLSTSGNLRPYEKRLFKKKIAQGKKVKGERERIDAATGWMNEHISFIDMTGYDDDHRKAGGGGIKEIARRINQVLRANPGTECGLVVIDYVGAMVKRQMAAEDLDDAARRHLISDTPLLTKAQIADQFDCPIWFMHQMSGEANARGEGAKMHHTDSAEAKNFAENLDFAFVLGNTNSDNLATLACTKRRRQPPKDSTIIKIDGGMNRVLDMEDRFVLDTRTKKIMSHDEQHKLPHAPGEQAAASAPSPVMLDE